MTTPAEVMRESYDEWTRKVYAPEPAPKWTETHDRGVKLAVQHDEATLRAALAIRSAHNRKLGKPLGA